jgi:transcription antitermination factor NusG
MGNLAAVFLDYAKRAEQVMRDMDARRGKRDAEVVEGISPSWHVLLIEPQREATAAGHLVGRRFGIYLPMLYRKMVSRGRLIEQSRPMFPGYLFVFVWDLDTHRGRIMACPGVSGVLMVDDVRYAVVPDIEIDKMQAAEHNSLQWLRPHAAAAHRYRPRRGYRKNRLAVAELDPADELAVIGIGPYSAMLDYEALDDVGRISVLRDALGLGSQPSETRSLTGGG